MILLNNKSKTLFYSLVACILTCLILSFNFLSDVPSCSAAFSESDERLKRIETDLSREKEQYLKFNEKEKALLKQLSEIEADIEEKRSSVKKLKEEINRRKKELGERQKYLEQLNKSLINIEGLLSRRLVAFYKYAKKGYLQVLSTTTSLDQLAKRMKYLKVILGGDKAAMSFMLKELIKYRQESAYLEKDLDIIAQLEKKENSQLSSIKQDLEKKVILLAKIHREKEFYETAVRELEHAAENIKQTIMNLEIEDDTEKVKGLPEDFNTSKGNLALPLEGDIIKDSEELGSNPLIPQKGIYIRGSLGKDVKAIFPGRVDFSGQLKGYGQVVVINHGSRYFTVSANLLERTREEGDMVKEGDVIGLVGETGLKIGPGLYFEIRKGEENLEPLKWLKVN